MTLSEVVHILMDLPFSKIVESGQKPRRIELFLGEYPSPDLDVNQPQKREDRWLEELSTGGALVEGPLHPVVPDALEPKPPWATKGILRTKQQPLPKISKLVEAPKRLQSTPEANPRHLNDKAKAWKDKDYP